jgi:hypothetical protein
MSLGTERSDVASPDARVAAVSGETPQLSLAGASGHCVNCAAPLASDQRYCVVCGERRGKPRFALAGPHEEVVQETITTRTASAPRRPRTSAAFNLIAGIATLLLAMGVGVLIGHNNSSGSSIKQAATPAITINSGGAASGSSGSTAASTGSGSGNSASTGGKSKKGASTKGAKNAPPKVVVQKAAAAASKVTGGNAKVADPTVTQGGACQSGSAGCQNGHFTGNNFFGQ